MANVAPRSVVAVTLAASHSTVDRVAGRSVWRTETDSVVRCMRTEFFEQPVDVASIRPQVLCVVVEGANWTDGCLGSGVGVVVHVSDCSGMTG